MRMSNWVLPRRSASSASMRFPPSGVRALSIMSRQSSPSGREQWSVRVRSKRRSPHHLCRATPYEVAEANLGDLYQIQQPPLHTCGPKQSAMDGLIGVSGSIVKLHLAPKVLPKVTNTREIKNPLDGEVETGLIFVPSDLPDPLIQLTQIASSSGNCRQYIDRSLRINHLDKSVRLMRDRWWFSFARFIKKEAKVAVQIGRPLTDSQCEITVRPTEDNQVSCRSASQEKGGKL